MNILQEIVEYKKYEVEEQKKVFSKKDLTEKANFIPKNFNLFEILTAKKNCGEIALIAEVKKASPSKGVIRQDFSPVEIAETYANCGASAISVLTDEKFFQGRISYLEDVKKAVEVPILRKDFIIDEFQILQTKAIGADIILLIASVLDKSQLQDFSQMSKELGLDVLLEVHDEKETETALDINAEIIGVNNRNLNNFEVSLDTTARLIKTFNDKNRHFISESGIKTAEDVKYLSQHGVSGILVGESLMKQKNIEQAVKNLLYFV